MPNNTVYDLPMKVEYHMFKDEKIKLDILFSKLDIDKNTVDTIYSWINEMLTIAHKSGFDSGWELCEHSIRNIYNTEEYELEGEIVRYFINYIEANLDDIHEDMLEIDVQVSRDKLIEIIDDMRNRCGVSEG